MKLHLRWLLHNAVAHPICGALWFVGLNRAADRLHAATVPAGKGHHG